MKANFDVVCTKFGEMENRIGNIEKILATSNEKEPKTQQLKVPNSLSVRHVIIIIISVIYDCLL